jgi:hypothetical protein
MSLCLHSNVAASRVATASKTVMALFQVALGLSPRLKQGDIHLKNQGKGPAKLLNAEKFGFSANLVNNKIPFDSKIW